jgi:vanillate O-demethylase monooxygenase subunit
VLQREVILGEPIVLWRKADGTVSALTDECPHRAAPLSKGRVVANTTIECPYHGLQFDGAGACVFNPHSERIPAAARLRRYPVVERHSILWIWMGEARPDAASIPDFAILDERSDYSVGKRDRIDLPVNYRLMTDNLMDLSHVSYLHDGILGHPGMARGELKVELSGTTVTARRMTRNVSPPGMFDLMYRQDQMPVDTWADMRWSVPSNLLNYSGVCPVGAEPDEGIHIYGAHLLTPVNELSTTYRIAAAKPRNALVGAAGEGDELAKKLAELRRFAFEEQDEPMVLSQQAAHLRAGGLGRFKPVLLSIDAGPERVRRILDGLIEEEERARPLAAIA